jgi:Drexlerviridae HNH endonuclease
MSKKDEPILNRLRAGWRVDADAGLVYGLNGEEIGYLHRTGYVKTSIWRGEQVHPLVVKRAQVVWVSVHGPVPDGFVIDHINRVRHDDRISNLRLVTVAENHRNWR